jgi:hypothetical protein
MQMSVTLASRTTGRPSQRLASGLQGNPRPYQLVCQVLLVGTGILDLEEVLPKDLRLALESRQRSWTPVFSNKALIPLQAEILVTTPLDGPQILFH